MITSGPQQHGIPEVPNHLDPTTQTFLRQLKVAVLKKAGDPTPARQVPQVQVTPASLSNVVQWVMTDADYYMVYASRAQDISQASVMDVGQSNEYHHFGGKDAVKWFYWVQACRNGVNKNSDPVGPFSGTTLAAGTTVVVPNPPPSPDIPTIDTSTGHVQRSVGRNLPDLP